MSTATGRTWRGRLLTLLAVTLVIGGGVALGACGEESGTSGTDTEAEQDARREARQAAKERKEERARERRRRERARERESAPPPPEPEPEPPPEPEAQADRESGYDPCVPPYSQGDVDCADVSGPISVTGADPHGLDADGD